MCIYESPTSHAKQSVVLVALFAGAGAPWPADPREGPRIDPFATFEVPEDEAGEYVETCVVVEIDPVINDLAYDGTTEHLEVENARDVEEGPRLDCT